MAKNLEMALLIDIYSSVLTQKQREMLELYYYEDLSLAEIAENCGISRQGVRDAIKRGEAVILDLEEQLGCAKKQKLLLQMRDRIAHNAKDIKIYNDKLSYSEHIERAADDILAALDEIEK